MASRAIFLPTISHAISHSVQHRAHSFSLKEKLHEIARQECHTATDSQEYDAQTIQQSVTTRLWRLMQCRLLATSTSKNLVSFQTSSSTLPAADMAHDDRDLLDISNLAQGDEELFELVSQSDTRVAMILSTDSEEEELLDMDHDSGWEHLFTHTQIQDDTLDTEMLDHSSEDEMLDDQSESDIDQMYFSNLGEWKEDEEEEMMEPEYEYAAT
jgi:hypothetical protein